MMIMMIIVVSPIIGMSREFTSNLLGASFRAHTNNPVKHCIDIYPQTYTHPGRK